jgi:hypothetical protein
VGAQPLAIRIGSDGGWQARKGGAWGTRQEPWLTLGVVGSGEGVGDAAARGERGRVPRPQCAQTGDARRG